RSAYLADHDHVRGFAQDVAQGFGKAQGVESHLALVDDRLLVPVQKLDRILDADDVPGAVGGAVVEHGGQGGRFARAGGAVHRNQAAVEHHQLFQNRGQPQLGDTRDLVVDVPHHHGHFATLVVDVDPEAPRIGHAHRQVHFQGAFELGNLLLTHQLVGQLLDLARSQRLFLKRVIVTLALEGDRGTYTEEQVGAVAFGKRVQITEDVHGMTLS